MNMTVARQVAELELMTIGQLLRRFEEVFGEQCRSRHRRYLIRRIAWRLQADAEGGLSERALRRIEELANESEIRTTAPRSEKSIVDGAETKKVRLPPARDPRLPPAGSWLERNYKGQRIRVFVLADGFEYEGERFGSLTAIAKQITGSHMNGFAFFHLWRKK